MGFFIFRFQYVCLCVHIDAIVHLIVCYFLYANFTTIAAVERVFIWGSYRVWSFPSILLPLPWTVQGLCPQDPLCMCLCLSVCVFECVYVCAFVNLQPSANMEPLKPQLFTHDQAMTTGSLTDAHACRRTCKHTSKQMMALLDVAPFQLNWLWQILRERHFILVLVNTMEPKTRL